MGRKKKPKNFKPVLEYPEGHRHYGKARCQAWSPNQGRQCLALAMRDRDKCRSHGGKTPRGVGSPHWKHGRYAKYLPTGLHERYDAALKDPEILALDDEIALLRTRSMLLVEKIASLPDSGSTWRNLNKQLTNFERAQRAAQRAPEGEQREKKLSDAAQSLEDLRMIIRRGVAEWAAWGEVITLTEHIRRLIDSEQRRRVEGQHILYVEDVMALFDYMVNQINETVSNPKEKARLSESLYRFSRRMDGAEARLGNGA